MLAPQGTKIADGAGLSLAVTEVSDRNVAILLEGPSAASVLAAGCALDFDHFEVGRATRTIFETVEIIIVREAADRFHVEVWRSFAPWLWTAFVTVAAE
jgi:sarcosine oxidase subunit gamma